MCVCRWDKVTRLEKGKIYAGGTIDQFQKLTGYTGHSVMYFGEMADISTSKYFCAIKLAVFSTFMTLVHQLSLLSGDHPYADLADVTLHHGWHTGAVIRELEAEIVQMNTDQFKWGVNWIQVKSTATEGFTWRESKSKSGHLKPSHFKPPHLFILIGK